MEREKNLESADETAFELSAPIIRVKSQPNHFVMENAETHLLMGYIGLYVDGRVGRIEYYVFKKHRRHGYCREAAKAVIAAAFEGKLRESYDYDPDAGFKSSPMDVECIKARVFEYNLASENLLRSLGFTYSGYDFSSRRFPDDSHVTEKLFYLKNPKTV